MSLKAIALLRVSSIAQAAADREGLPVQRETCQRIAGAHGLDIIDWVELEGVSGAAVLSNPGFAALLGRLQEPEIYAVVCAAFDRLFRPSRFSDFAILDAFAETGTRLFTADGELDLAAESGGLLGVIRGQLAGMERKAIIRRTTAGRRRKRREKGVRAEGPVGMPRGVRFDYETDSWEYMWPEAGRVLEAFQLLLSGIHNLAEIGRRTGIGGLERSSAVLRVLQQPLYAGYYVVSRTWEDGRPTPLPEGEIQRHQVLDPPLVSVEDWWQAQRILARLRDARPSRIDREKLGATYAGHLICARCGGPVSPIRDSRGYVRYQCARKSKQRDRRQRTHCGMGGVSSRLADPVLDQQVERVLGDAETLAYLLDANTREDSQNASPSAAEIGRKLTMLENRRQRIRDAYDEGDYDLRELRKREGAVEAEKAALDALMDTQEPWTPPEDLVTDLVDVFSSWSDLQRHERRSLLRDYRLEIVVETQGEKRRRWLRVDRLRLLGLPPHVWLYNDIAWPGTAREVWRVFEAYYAAVPEGVVNDRWLPGVPWARWMRLAPVRALVNRLLARAIRKRGFEPMPPPAHCDFRTPEYTSFDTIQRRKWESTRGLGNSFCWNRNEDPAAVPTVQELVTSLADIVSKNGNLLLNVGPRGEDASLPEEQRERIEGLGEWLGRSGEALYGSRPHTRAEGETGEGVPVRFTRRGATVHAILLGAPGGDVVTLPLPEPGFAGTVRLLGHGPVKGVRQGGRVQVAWPSDVPRRIGAAFAFEAA